MPWCACADRSSARRAPLRRSSVAVLSAHFGRLPGLQRAILPHQQIEVRALLVGELEEDLLALGILEALAVFLEEPVRAALALDADEQRFLIVDAAPQLLGPLREQPARRAFEEQERRPRLELWIPRQQLAVALLEGAEMLLLFGRELLKHRAAARIPGQAGGAGVELEAAALRGNGHAQRVPREHQLRHRAVDRRRAAAGAALLADPGDLHGGLRRLEVSRRGDLLEQRFDIGTEELGRGVTRGADQVEVARVAIGRLEAGTALAKIHLTRDAGADQPLQRAIHRRPADAGL